MAIKLGTAQVKLIYLDSRLVFADMRILTLTLGTGVTSVTYSGQTIDSKSVSGTITSSTEVPFDYGTSLTIKATAADGYDLDSYTTAVVMTADNSISITAHSSSFFTNVNLNYGGTEYGDSVGSLIGTFQYSRNKSSWSGSISNEDWSTKFDCGSYLYIRNITAAPGFALSNVTYNGSTISPSSGIYTITIGAGEYTVDINFVASTSTSSIGFTNTTSVTTNTLSRNAWTVTCSVNVAVAECGAGTVIGTVPEQYRPATAQTTTVTWCTTTTNSNSSSTTATITINTDGTIVSSLDSTGAGSSSGGGKWGSYTTTWATNMSFTLTWSVK